MGGVKPPPMPDDVSRASESEETGGLLAEASDAFKTQTPTDRLIAALKSPYFWANVVYLFYTCQALAVDFCSISLHPPVLAPAPAPAPSAPAPVGLPAPAPPAPGWHRPRVWHEAPQCAETGNSPVYKQYEFLAAVHLFNAFQYLYLWRPWFRAHAASHTRLFLACVLLPELLNVLEASLYLRTATRYMAVQSNPACVAGALNPSWFKCADLLALHATELYASLIELVASFLWLWSWLATREAQPGRGLTMWDLDCHSSFLLILGSAIYVMYNFQIAGHPEDYGSNVVYHSADVIYFIGAVLYTAASLRDVDCFFWLHIPGMPTAASVEEGGEEEEEEEAEVELTEKHKLAPALDAGEAGESGGKGGCWEKVTDASTGAVYFYHTQSREVRWTNPDQRDGCTT